MGKLLRAAIKQASQPEMGEALHTAISSATGDGGRARHRTNDNPGEQVNSAFSEHDRHMRRDPHNDAHVLPVSLFQSKTGAAYKLHGRRKFRGLDISIENRKGSYRHWYDKAADKEGKTLQRYPYGYVRRSKGMDGDHVDCYVGDNEGAKYVYVITTSKPPDFKAVDEQKCMLGFNSAAEAKRVFLQHYDSGKFFRHMVAMPYATFEKKVLSTLHGRIKKIASNTSLEELEDLISRGPGSVEGQVPGDHLGLPIGSLVGARHIGGNAMSPRDRIDRQFRFMDQFDDTRVLEGDTAALPESPGV